ncbi:hypothetical protein, partial [Endozoicomonas acroporae]|uniref:hypothetical protein n=1 Tax=Endozoicomonas acroporae TaxID=1701104 RepID=UPI003D7A6A46
SLLLINLVIFIFPEKLVKSTVSMIWMINGLGYELFIIGTLVNVQNLCPKNLIGRITTSTRSMQMACVVTEPSIGAFLINIFNRSIPFAVSFLLSILLIIIIYFASIERSKYIKKEQTTNHA